MKLDANYWNCRTTLAQLIILIIVPWAAVASFVSAEDLAWPEFRGPEGNGHATAKNLPEEFGESNNLTWKTSLPGRAWSSPIVAGNEIWVTTAIETVATPAERERKLADARSQGLSAYSKVELNAICIDLNDGKIKREIALFEIEDPPLIHSLNSFASPTPVCDDSRVYCHFGTFGTACIDRSSGDVIWRNQQFQLDHETGPGSSPILWNDLLIFHCDGYDHQYVVAVDTGTGEQVWRTERSGELPENGTYKKAFSTPFIARREGSAELISAASNWIYGYDPADGKELWKISYGQLGFSNVARPIVDEDTLYVCSCFMQSKMMAVDLSGTDPVVDDDVKWTYKQQVPNMPSPIQVDGGLYFVSDRGIVTRLDAETGEETWRGRLGGEYSASPIFADGKLYFGNRDGMVIVIEPGDELNVLSRNQLDSAIMASPAAFDDTILVRTQQSLYRFEKD